MNLLKVISEKYQSISNRPQLCAKSAYALTVLNKQGNLEDVYQDLKKGVLSRIKSYARSGNIEIYIKYPTYILKEHKDALIKDLENQGFKVLYSSDKSMIVSWGQN